MEPRISLITLGVADLGRSLRFYRDGLGLPTTWNGDRGVVFFQTSGTCLSIFKPIFTGVELPQVGTPTEQFDPKTLWWKHELLHRRAMTDFDGFVPLVRAEFDALEDEFLAAAPSVLKGSLTEKKQFMDDCFRRAEQVTDKWITALSTRAELTFADAEYSALWQKYNNMAGLMDMPI